MRMKDLKKHSKCSTSLPETTLIGLSELGKKSTVSFYKILCLSEYKPMEIPRNKIKIKPGYCSIDQSN